MADFNVDAASDIHKQWETRACVVVSSYHKMSAMTLILNSTNLQLEYFKRTTIKMHELSNIKGSNIFYILLVTVII